MVADSTGATAALNLAAQIVGAPARGAEGHLELGARASGDGRGATGHIELFGRDVATAVMTASVVIVAEGVISSVAPLTQAWQYVLNLSIIEVGYLYFFLVQQVNQVLTDPREALISLIVCLPMLALILRRLNKR